MGTKGNTHKLTNLCLQQAIRASNVIVCAYTEHDSTYKPLLLPRADFNNLARNHAS